MDVREELVRAVQRCSRREFVQRYPNPFLAIRIEVDEDGAEFRTSIAPVRPMSELTPPPSPTTALVGEIVVPVTKRAGANQFSFITIGRAANNDVVIPLNSVSKCHAVLHPAGDRFTVADAGSKNGTVLNGQRLEANRPAKVDSGDTLILANRVTITFMDAISTYVWLRSLAR